MLRKVSQIVGCFLWLLSTLTVLIGLVDLFRWGIRRGIFPLNWMEYPEREAIAVALAGIVSVFSSRLIPVAWWGCKLVSLTRWIVMVVGICFLIAKGTVCAFSEDSQIAQLHHMTFWAVGLMVLASCWPMPPNETGPNKIK